MMAIANLIGIVPDRALYLVNLIRQVITTTPTIH